MASPVDAGRTPTNVSTAANVWTVNYPASVAAGDLLIALYRESASVGNPNYTAAGFALLANSVADASDDNTLIFYRWADGSETGTFNLQLNGASSNKGAVIVWRITGAADPAVTAMNISTVAIGTTAANSANATSVSVTGGPKDVLYLVVMGLDGELNAPTAAPTNYVNLQTANSGTAGAVATNLSIGGGTRQVSASSSEDPGAFTHAAAANGWTAWVVAVPPPAAATYYDDRLMLRSQAVNRASVY